jgi:hypothetical protein
MVEPFSASILVSRQVVGNETVVGIDIQAVPEE